MAKIIRNIDTENHTYNGKIIEPDESYTLQYNEEIPFANCNELISDIANNKVQINNGSYDIEGISAQINFLKDEIFEIDTQGRQVTRTAIAQKGWTYLAKFVEFETSKVGSLKCRNSSNENTSDVTIKFFNNSNQEVTASENDNTIVRTEILFKPSSDIELLSGHIHQISCPSTNIFLNVIGGIIELGSNYTKDFVTGMNLAFMGADESIVTDGRATKYLTKTIAGVPYQANQLKFIIYHDVGIQHRLMFVLEYYRA